MELDLYKNADVHELEMCLKAKYSLPGANAPAKHRGY